MKTKFITFILILIMSGSMVFAQNKDEILKKQPSVIKIEFQKDSVYYTCPTNPDIQMDKPGKCPKCGMKLEKRTIKVTENKKEKTISKIYFCPVHPEIKLDKPGKCPKCGVDLKMKKYYISSSL